MAKAKAATTKVMDPFDPINGSAKLASRTGAKKNEIVVNMPAKIGDQFARLVELRDQMKHLKGEMDACENEVDAWGMTTYAQEHFKGGQGNLRLLGPDSVTGMFIVQDRGGITTREDQEEFIARRGQTVADALLERDMNNVKVDMKVLMEHRDAIVTALNKVLPPEAMASLFVFKLGTKDDIQNLAKDHAKSASDLEQLYRDLRLVTQIRKG